MKVDQRFERLFTLPSNGEETVQNVYPIAPGQSRILCLGGGRDPSDESLFVPLEVVDESGLWTSPTLECPIEDQAFRADVFYATPPVGEAGDPVDLVRKYLLGIQPDDVVERAGYPDAPFPGVRVVRGGRTIAIVQLMDNGEGRWVFLHTGGAFGYCSSDVGGFSDAPLG